jgi:predicted house-cleaning noncanonical NTP pyrophosphatase (MazG superfamily)
MAVTIRALEELAGQLQLAEQVEVAPTLVIGLGGSGTWTARRLKKLMQQRYGKDIPLIRFLFLDCDQGAFTSQPKLADVQDDEKVALFIRNPERIWQEVQEGIGERAKWRDWLPEQLNVGILRHAIGAGGIRPVGRFALFASLQEVWERLTSALRDILAIEQQLRMTLGDQAGRVVVHYSEPRIYIIGSLCGGTGSSIFLDIAVLVRHCLRQIAPDAQPSILGVFFLPSVFAGEPTLRSNIAFLSVLKANGYAALKELEHFCDGMALQSQPFTFRYPLIGDVTVNAPVYDEDFVVEDGTPDGRHLNSKEEVFEMVARSLLVDIGSPFGSRLRSARANFETVLQMERCPQTGKVRLIHSLGMTSVAVPIAEIVKRGALQRLRQFLTDHALGQELSASELEREVNEFLQANKLEERGDRNDLLERLLTRDGEVLNYTLPRTREELEREAGGSELQQAHYVAEWIEQEMNRLRTQLLSEAQRLVQENQIAVLRDATTDIANRLTALIQQKGLRAARQFVGELRLVFQTVRDELLREQQEYDQNIKGALENAIANHVAFLRGLQGVWGSLKALGRVDEQAMDEALRRLQDYGNAEPLSVARRAVLELLGSDQPIGGQLSLLRQLEEWERALEQAIGKLNELERRCGEGLHTRLPSKPTGSTSNSEYVLERWVIQPSEFDAYLQDIALDPATYRDALWQKLGGDFEGVVRTLREKSADTLLEELAQVIGEPLRDALANRLNILRVIQEKQQQFETILREMLRVCQPFWRAPRDGIGGVGYQKFFAVTVPAHKDDPQFREMEQTLQETAKEFGYQPETVHSGYPFAIEMGVRFYGARAFWINTRLMRQENDLMRQEYERKRQFPATAGLLHIDRRFLDLLPDLYEGVQQSG